MRTSTAIFIIALAFFVTGSSGAATPAGNQDRSGLVYRYYAGAGYRFQPLLSFANLENAVSRRDTSTAQRLARALLARGVRTGDAVYWPYDFSFGGGPSSWTSGFTQAVAANALARAGVLLRDDSLQTAAARAFAGLRRTLLLPMAGGGLWIREYSYTGQVILNAQLESVLELDSYASIAKTASARLVARVLERTSARLLPQFDLGCWGRYQLGGAAADTHYEAYHVDLLRRLAATHPDPIWRETYLRWRSCLH
jgi:D-glucuronyl C5-epimerase C-terminus